MAFDVLTGVKTMKVLVDVYKGALSISNFFLMKKISAFYENGDFAEDLLEKFKSQSIQEWESVQDIIIHSLTQAESIDKARYTRMLVNALLNKEIEFVEFERLAFVLQQLYSFDIPKIVEIKYDRIIDDGLGSKFASLGLLNKSAPRPKNGILGLGDTYLVSSLGHTFIRVFLRDYDEKIKNSPVESVKIIV